MGFPGLRALLGDGGLQTLARPFRCLEALGDGCECQARELAWGDGRHDCGWTRFDRMGGGDSKRGRGNERLSSFRVGR